MLTEKLMRTELSSCKQRLRWWRESKQLKATLSGRTGVTSLRIVLCME